MRPALRALLHLTLSPVYALGFLWHPIAAAFTVGGAWAQRGLVWMYKDTHEKAVKAALDKARKMFPGATCRAEGDCIIVEHTEASERGVKH